MENKNTILGEAPIGGLMKGYAIPCIISLLVGALYNIVDQIFIANASYLGSYGNAANTVVFPLTVVALAIAVMVGDGCCAFVSMALGREVVFGVGFALTLPLFFGLDGVLYSMPVSDVLIFLISAVIIVKTYRELNEQGVEKQ